MIAVYKILNITNNDAYVGSTINIKKRLNRGVHHSPHLQRAWDLYGMSNFIFEIVEECNRINVYDREQYYLDNTNTRLRSDIEDQYKNENINFSNIIKCCKGTYKKSYGYIWKFKNII